jgi:hypothetical protein
VGLFFLEQRHYEPDVFIFNLLQCRLDGRRELVVGTV